MKEMKGMDEWDEGDEIKSGRRAVPVPLERTVVLLSIYRYFGTRCSSCSCSSGKGFLHVRGAATSFPYRLAGWRPRNTRHGRVGDHGDERGIRPTYSFPFHCVLPSYK